MTQAMLSGIQMAMAREGRLADEPFGPEPATTVEEKRAHFKGADIEAGDIVEMRDGVTATVQGVIPSECDSGIGADAEWFVHLAGADPEHGDFWLPEVGYMFGGDLARGDKTLVDGDSA